jgi:uncharacterized membrane protein
VGKGRLEAFSDGVIAIIITIMVLELKVPDGPTLAALRPLGPLFASYVVSFTFVGIYWNGHHHMLHVCRHVGARVLWMNLLFLFCLSLIPVVTAWVGEYPHDSPPAALYGAVLLCAALAYNLLQRAIRVTHADEPQVVALLRPQPKALASEVLYACGIAVAFVHPYAADVAYVAVAVMWFIPDRRIEHVATGKTP